MGGDTLDNVAKSILPIMLTATSTPVGSLRRVLWTFLVRTRQTSFYTPRCIFNALRLGIGAWVRTNIGPNGSLRDENSPSLVGNYNQSTCRSSRLFLAICERV